MTKKRIYLIAGEPSGDLLGARLMRGLKEQTNNNIEFFGIGGPNMEAEGMTSLFPMKELSIMGLAEIIPHIPKILKRIKQTIQNIETLKPDCLVTIDAPGFTFRVAKKLKGKGIPLCHYVAPSVWAWKPKRAKKVAQFLDHLMVLLPFEPPYFEREGLATTFVGHSVIESEIEQADGDAFRARHGIPQDVPLLCLLPGSRQSETSQLLPVFEDALALIRKQVPNLRIVLPTVSTVAKIVKETTAGWNIPVLIVEGNDEKFGTFKAANVALAASGTVSLELALAQTPTVITYRMKKMTHWLAKRLIKVKYASIVNLLHDREVMPELLQDECTPENIATEVIGLLKKDRLNSAQQADLESAMVMLGKGESDLPSKRAAKCVLSLITKE
ncbi:lipid-A-disaccharide synthase [Terasakiella pusilla]|uniref:lipid-A-disaccharide synthase n=1 Tax=Terasakiella pusilla TaxID=64973 RepID=UPI003AA94D27